MKDFVNPFANKGRIVSDSDFIGRFEELETIEVNVTEQLLPNNMAIIGYPRVGKSSLAKQSIIREKDYLLSKGNFAVWVDFSGFSNRDAFFKYLVHYSYDALKEGKKTDDEIDEKALSVIKQTLPWDDLKYEIEGYFKTVRRKGYFIIFVLDEFDDARNIFKDNTQAFRMLRALGYDSEKYGVSFVTTSRRSIKEIEKQSKSSSNLDLIFGKKYLKMYSDTDMEEYYSLFEKAGLQLTETDKQFITYCCGNHPFLLATLGFEIIEKFRKSEDIDINLLFEKIELTFWDYYKELIDLLEEDNTFEKLLQIIFGPMLDVANSDLRELKDYYGLVEEFDLLNGDKGLKAFSEHFQNYLGKLGKEVDFWSLWIDLELTLRETIFTVMKNNHQEQWLRVLKTRHPEIFQKAEETRDKSREDSKSENLLDYLDAQPIFEIVYSNKNWNDFKHIFGGDKAKNSFIEKMELIIKIRNPYAHSRFNSINSSSVKQAEIYCESILKELKAHLSTSPE